MMQRMSITTTASARRKGLAAALALAALLFCAAKSFAQEFLTLPVDDKAKVSRSVALQCLKDPAAFAANKAKFDEYFTKFYFPSITRTEPEALGNLGRIREDFFKQILSEGYKSACTARADQHGFDRVGKDRARPESIMSPAGALQRDSVHRHAGRTVLRWPSAAKATAEGDPSADKRSWIGPQPTIAFRQPLFWAPSSASSVTRSIGSRSLPKR